LTVNFGAYEPEMPIDFAYDCKQSPWLVWQSANYRQARPHLEKKWRSSRPFGQCDLNDTLSPFDDAPGLVVHGRPLSPRSRTFPLREPRNELDLALPAGRCYLFFSHHLISSSPKSTVKRHFPDTPSNRYSRIFSFEESAPENCTKTRSLPFALIA
jgi:hypothetical protein